MRKMSKIIFVTFLIVFWHWHWKCQKCKWKIVEIGLFRFLVSDSVATFGTINQSQVWNDRYNCNAFRNPSSTHFHVEIPNTITYQSKVYSVTVIGCQALRCAQITSLRIPRNIQIILSYAIDICTNLKYVYFDPDSSLSFIDHSFCVKSIIRSIRLPASITTIGSGIFTFCDKLKEVYFAGNPLNCESELSSANFIVYVDKTYKSNKFCNKNVISLESFQTRRIDSCRYMQQQFTSNSIYYLNVLVLFDEK